MELRNFESRVREVADGTLVERIGAGLWRVDWRADKSRTIVAPQASLASELASLGKTFILATEEEPSDSPEEIATVGTGANFHVTEVPAAADWGKLMRWLTPQAWLGLVFRDAGQCPGEFVWDIGRIFASPTTALALLDSLDAMVVVVPYYDNDSWIVGLGGS